LEYGLCPAPVSLFSRNHRGGGEERVKVKGRVLSVGGNSVQHVPICEGGRAHQKKREKRRGGGGGGMRRLRSGVTGMV